MGCRRAIIDDNLLFDCALKLIDGVVAQDDASGQLGVALFQRFERIAQELLGQPAHLADFLVERRTTPIRRI